MQLCSSFSTVIQRLADLLSNQLPIVPLAEMASRHRSLRTELAALLGVDQYTLDDVSGEIPPPPESLSNHLSSLIAKGIVHDEDARTVYEYLPIIMLRIFGYSTGHGWLETAAELQSRDREALLRIVIPDGPLHAFCRKYSPQRSAEINVSADMRFEFSRDNLPQSTDAALSSPVTTCIQRNMRNGQSFLAPLLASSLRNAKDQVLLLSPIDYFYACMVASPTQKLTVQPGSLPPGAKRPKRSTSLPSTRALYNQIIGRYAASFKGTDAISNDDAFIAACIDFLFVPWASSSPSTGLPICSTGVADAVGSILLALVPATPSSLDLESASSASSIPSYIDWNMQTNTSAVYRAVETMLESVFTNYDANAPPGTLISYIRVLALYIAPWRSSIQSALRKALYPKPRPQSSISSKSPSIAAITSTLSSINAHLGAASTGSPGNASLVKESQWKADLRARQQVVDEELLRLAVVRAANHRLASTADGSRVLSLLAEAVQMAHLQGRFGLGDADQDRAEEIRNCLFALRDQKIEMERRSSHRERNYISVFSSGLGVRLDNGMFSGMADIVGVSGANGVAGVVGLVSRSGAKSNSGSKQRLRERRAIALQGRDQHDVPFLGNVWDRPIAHGENEMLVLSSYWLALRLEPIVGFVPDIRFLGSYWVWFMIVSLLVVVVSARALVEGAK